MKNEINAQAITWQLHENPLTTDYVEIAPKGYHFKGGMKYILHYYTYANEWSDRENIKRFKKLETLEKYYNKLNRGDLYNDYSIDCAEV